MKSPRVTVLLPVYNAEEFLAEAIESVLNQSFKDFEFMIINDGSKDNSLSVIKHYAEKDSRINLISRPNKGLVKTLNEGISKAKGEYIARMDSDDVSVKSRLKKEVEFLDSNPGVGMVGSNYTIIDAKGKRLVTTNVFTHHDDLKLCLITCNQFGHGSVMMRKSVLEKVGNYDGKVGHVEDYDLWQRISRVSKISNFEEPLYLWRKTEGSISNANLDLQIQQTFALRDKAFDHFLRHRNQYKVFTVHRSGTEYGKRKATMYRDLGYLYRMRDKPLGAFLMVILAILFQPNYKRNYKYLILALYKPWFHRWTFEFL